ncbi:MAG: DUF2029 domain-containing protein [Chloroflexi bacterium]|nr:DUF2029 domain-containing protein [Chloroflexota bacterium]
MKRTTVEIALLIVVLGVLLTNESLIPRGIASGDFRAYWSTSYLLARGENPWDPTLLLRTEQEQAGWREAFPVLTWNPPWLGVLILPYAFVSFATAERVWLLTNIALVGLGAVLVWHDSTRQAATRRRAWVGLVIAFSFAMTLLTLGMGQVNTLVFAGLALFLYFSRARRDALAGAALWLTTVKPHLVYLTLPVLFLGLVRTRRWRALMGFGVGGASLLLSLFLLRPTWLGEYLQNIGGGQLLAWETPTVGGIAQLVFGLTWAKWLGLVILPLVIWRFTSQAIPSSWRTWVDITLLLGIPTAPFGWSYDQVLLLIPILRVATWLCDGELAKRETILIGVLLIAANALAFYERTLTPSEVYFFWVPWLVAIVYGYVARRVTRVHSISDDAVASASSYLAAPS